MRLLCLGRERRPPTCLGVKLGAVCVYVDGVFELVWEVVPVCTGGYEDIVSFFEVDYGWNVVCTMWYDIWFVRILE